MRPIFILAMAFITTSAHSDEFEKCRTKLKSAQQLGILHALDWQKGKLPHVVAGRTYYQMPYDAKEGFADALNCFLTGGATPKTCISFEIKHWQTGKPTEAYKNCRLKPI